VEVTVGVGESVGDDDAVPVGVAVASGSEASTAATMSAAETRRSSLTSPAMHSAAKIQSITSATKTSSGEVEARAMRLAPGVGSDASTAAHANSGIPIGVHAGRARFCMLTSQGIHHGRI
jgi:hypothetical protein